jgi:hypothetical protein
MTMPDAMIARARRLHLAADIGVARVEELCAVRDEFRRRSTEAPEATVEALVYQFRAGGLDALHTERARLRLTELSADQLDAVIIRLADLRAKYPAITEELIRTIAEMIS